MDDGSQCCLLVTKVDIRKVIQRAHDGVLLGPLMCGTTEAYSEGGFEDVE